MNLLEQVAETKQNNKKNKTMNSLEQVAETKQNNKKTKQ